MTYNRAPHSHREISLEVSDVRPFDIAGIFFVVLWIGSVAAFVWMADDDRGVPLTGEGIELQEGTSFKLVYRDNEEIGILREDRTWLADSWLIETQGYAEMQLMDEAHALFFESRTTLDNDLTVQSATGTVRAYGMELDMHGELRGGDDPEFHVDLTLEDAVERFVADLDEPPRLATHAIPEILAGDEPEPGDRFHQEFFDPITMAPAELDITYEGRQQIETAVGDGYNAYEFVQSVGHLDTRMYTDSDGMILLQALPMSIDIQKIPEQIGPARFSDFEEQLEEALDESPAFVDAFDPADLLAVAAQFGSGEFQRLEHVDDQQLLAGDRIGEPEDDEPQTYRLSPLPESNQLDLISPRQHLAVQTAERARLETGPRNALWHTGHTPDNSEYQPVAEHEAAEQVDELADALSESIDTDADNPVAPEAAVEPLEQFCPADALRTRPELLDEHWPAPLDSEPTSYLECLALLADALAAVGLTPHLVHGAHYVDEPHPHLWLALYVDGRHRGEIDPFSPGGAPTSQHVQLYLDDEFSPDLLEELTDALELD